MTRNRGVNFQAFAIVSLEGGPGGPEPPRNLADQLTLFKPWGADYARNTTAMACQPLPIQNAIYTSDCIGCCYYNMTRTGWTVNDGCSLMLQRIANRTIERVTFRI